MRPAARVRVLTMAGVRGIEALDALAGLLGNLEATLIREAVPPMAAEIGATAQAQWSAGKGPDGKAWPRNKDGSIPLRTVTAAIRFVARGRRIVASADEVIQYHREKRPVFPEGDIPGPWLKAAERALGKTVTAIFKRARG